MAKDVSLSLAEGVVAVEIPITQLVTVTLSAMVATNDPVPLPVTSPVRVIV